MPMKKTWNTTVGLLALLLTTALAVTPAAADKPEGKGKGHDRAEKGEQRQDKSRGDDHVNRGSGGLTPRAGVYFADQHRGRVRDYYGAEFKRGFCPPGLAKKNNGCMPPGQAKKWAIGSPIPRDVVYYDLPQPLVVQIGAPPAGYRYVRAAADILLISIGTGIVVDVMVDLGRV
jgi:Ni/Co efflux regulator RcnB